MYPGLRYAHKILNFACKKHFFEQCLFEYEIRFEVENENLEVRAIDTHMSRSEFAPTLLPIPYDLRHI